jgi:hypothetical protein
MSNFFDTMVSLVRGSVNYATIVKWKAEMNIDRKRGEKVTTKDFLALSPGNDPFFADHPTHKKWGEWFAENWQRYKSHLPTVHVRALHYTLYGLLKSGTPCVMPNGKIYDNTKTCWKALEMAGKYARYNGLLPLDKWEDKRKQSLTELIYDESGASIGIYNPIEYDFDVTLPSFPSLPCYSTQFRAKQRYRIEVLCEKSTQDTVLEDICKRYRVTLLVAQGEVSISSMVKLIRRAESANMPTIIFYISDFDPAGRSMPVAASRKLEFIQSVLHSSVEIQLYPIALTYEQCVYYQLPSAPVNTSNVRKRTFEERYGSGVTELDALEDFHPGELGRLLEREILRFYDDTLEGRTWEIRRRLYRDTDAIKNRVYDAYQGESLEEEYATLRAEFDEWKASRWTPFQERLIEAYQGIVTSLEEQIPDINEYPLPEAKEVPTGDDCLYDSARSYLQQIAAYSAFTGKFSHLIEEDDEEETA